MTEDLGRERRPVAVLDVGRVGERRRRSRRGSRRAGRAGSSDVEAQARAVRARDGERVGADVAAALTRRSGRSVASARSATAPPPVPTSSTRRARGQREQPFDEQLGLRARDEHARDRPPARCGESPCADRDVGDGLACDRRLARRLGRRAPPDRTRGQRSARALAAITPSAWASSTSASSRGRFAPGRGDRGPSAVERLADAGCPRVTPAGLRLQPPPLLVGLQRGGELVRARPRGPASRLWTVSLMRWSVTRRSP